MSFSNIKKVVASALLMAFTSPSIFAVTTTNYDSAPATKSMILSGDVNLIENNDLVTLSLRDSDVKQVLRMFADKAGKNIVFHNSVTGKVTLDLVNTPINDAFNLVLQVSGLNYYQQGNTMIIMAKDSADNASYSKQEMLVFPVKYVNATKIADFLNKNIFGMKKAGISSVDAATVNSATNDLIVFGMKSDIPIIEKVIEQFDKKPFTKTFTVSHTTPAEMANMICQMLLPAGGAGDNSKGASNRVSSANLTTKNNPLKGFITGAAAAINGGGSGSDLKLGEGVVACSVAPASSSGTIAPFEIQNLSIAYFPQRGTITLMGGSEAQAAMVESFIKANDIKQPQAILEMSIVELTEQGSKEFQNNWSIQSKAWGFKFDGTSLSGGRAGGMGGNWVDAVQYSYLDGEYIFDPITNAPVGYNPPQFFETPIKVPMPATTYVSWTMNYLIENRKARVLANPKIMITNGQESVIDLTQDYVEKVTSEFLTSTSNGLGATGTVQRTYTISEDLGIKVSLTPFISPEGYVTLNIKPEYSTVAGEVRATGATGTQDLVATLLSRRDLDLKNIRIKDGETLIIGGMIQETEQKTVSKIPFLGDMPLLGPLFRSSTTSKSKNELIIMLTPKILNDDEGNTSEIL